MLYFRPDLVDMSKAKLFPSKAAEMEKDYKHLRPAGTHSFGWIAQDINPDGAVGDASLATAEKGRLTAEHQADAFIALAARRGAVSAGSAGCSARVRKRDASNPGICRIRSPGQHTDSGPLRIDPA